MSPRILADLPLGVRLRHRLAHCTGALVLVDRADLEAVLATPTATSTIPVAIAATTTTSSAGVPAAAPDAPPVPAAFPDDEQPPRRPAVTGPRARRLVVLGPSSADARRLAAAAWSITDQVRAGERPGWDRLEPSEQWALIRAARAAIDHLLATAETPVTPWT